MKEKNVLVIGINCSPELTGIGKYTGEMLDWMGRNGYRVTMVTAFPYYPQWKLHNSYKGRFYKKEILQDGQISVYRCPMYIPARPTGLKRLIHEASFFLSAFFAVTALLFRKKHEEIFCIAPPFHTGFLALYYRFFKGGKITYHIQDLQIDAAGELKILRFKFLLDFLFLLERLILRKSDRVSTISEGMKKRVLAKVDRPVSLLPNWVNTDLYYPKVKPDNLKSIWSFSPEDKIVLYSGSIGEKQGLQQLIGLAERLKGEKQIKILICGNGPSKDSMIKMAAELDLQNIHFFPLQEASVFNDFLNMADVHLILQKKDAADLVMPSKLTTILSVGGLVLVTAAQGTSLHEVINEHRMGIVIDPENETLLYTAVLDCCTKNHGDKKLNARKYAEIHLKQGDILANLFK